MTSNIRNWTLAALAIVLGCGTRALAQQQPGPTVAPVPAVAAAPGEPNGAANGPAYGPADQHVLAAGQPMTQEETLRELQELQQRLAWCEAQLQASSNAAQAMPAVRPALRPVTIAATCRPDHGAGDSGQSTGHRGKSAPRQQPA